MPEEKRQHRFLIYMGVLMSCGGILSKALTVIGGTWNKSELTAAFKGYDNTIDYKTTRAFGKSASCCFFRIEK